jgi:hypothetical protein
VPQALQFPLDFLLEVESGVVGAERDFHTAIVAGARRQISLYSGRAAAYNRRMTRRFSRYYWFTCQVGG